jgi:hypothetical protein
MYSREVILGMRSVTINTDITNIVGDPLSIRVSAEGGRLYAYNYQQPEKGWALYPVEYLRTHCADQKDLNNLEQYYKERCL